MPELLELTLFGNPILRAKARRLSVAEIKPSDTQNLITDIRYTNQTKKYGVGLAAPQVGVGVALSAIGIKPTPTRPNLEVFDSVIINPSYKGIGAKTSMWEGCQSCGMGDDVLFAQTMRHERIVGQWHDEHGKRHQAELDSFVAHVFQHETDHLNGILFVDRVKDTKTYMMGTEYRARILGVPADKQ